VAAFTPRRFSLSPRAAIWASWILLVLLLAYGAFGLLTLSRVRQAIDEAARADTAYQYSQVVRVLYKAAVACQQGKLDRRLLEEVQKRVELAIESASFRDLSPEAQGLLRRLSEEVKKPLSCEAYAAWAERVFPVQVEAVERSNWLRAEIKAQLRRYQQSLLFGLGLLFLAAALILYLLEQLRKAQAAEIRALENESRFKTRLLGLVAHELRTPLAAVAGFAELAAAARDEETRRRHLKSLSVASERMRTALFTFLDLHRLETTGGIATEPEPTELSALARGVLEIARGAYPKTLFSAALPEAPLVAEVDKNRLAHALLNLLENAAKYGRGEVRLRLGKGPLGCRFEVESEGELSPEIAERLFAPFARLPEHRGMEGWGLGLSLVKEVAEAHGGRAGLERREGTIVFFIELPSERCDFPPGEGAQAG